MRSARTARVAACLVAVAAVPLAGCGAGKAAATMHERPTVDSVQADAGDLQLRNVQLEGGPGGTWQPGASVPLDMSVINTGAQPDALVDGRVEGGGTVSASPSPLPVGPGAVVRLQGDASGAPAQGSAGGASSPAGGSTAGSGGSSGQSAQVRGTTRQLRVGDSVRLTLRFQRAGEVSLNVPVVATGRA